MQIPNNINSSLISVLIVDDSLVFRRFLRDILENCNDMTIAGEAGNGIEALDLILKTEPDVILLDVEMPLMDGMTALQHLMIHRPIPTIMFSSLTDAGTARCFDTMKNGAVDFINKDFIFQRPKVEIYKELLPDKIRRAALVKIQSREHAFSDTNSIESSAKGEHRVVFCEDCGHREIVDPNLFLIGQTVTCSNCGDIIELETDPQYHKNTFLTVMGGGEGSFCNLLEIIPRLKRKMSGAVVVVIHGAVQHVNAFSKYLNAISSVNVLRAHDGIKVEPGNCYLASGQDYMCLKSSAGQLTLVKLQKNIPDTGPLDVLLASVAAVFKNNAAGVILSGEETDGDKGLEVLIKNLGIEFILAPVSCLYKTMTQRVMKQCNIQRTIGIDPLVEKLNKLHCGVKNDIING